MARITQEEEKCHEHPLVLLQLWPLLGFALWLWPTDWGSHGASLGYGQVNLLSESYGTRLALIYAQRYPDALHRVIMNGANPPGHFLWYPDKTEEIIDQWEEFYRAAGRGSIKDAMALALDQMPRHWCFFSLDKDKVKTGTFIFLFSTDMAVMAFEAYFQAAERGDYGGLYLLQKAFDLVVPHIVWGDMFQKGFSADFDSQMDYRRYLRAFDENTLLGGNLALLLWGCAGTWQTEVVRGSLPTGGRIDTEILILSGALDVSTPAAYATEKLLPMMPNARQIVLPNMSHRDVISQQMDNYRLTVNAFFEQGHHGTVAFAAQALHLHPRYRLHLVVRWLLVGAAVIVLLLAVGVGLVVRKVIAKRAR